MSVRHQIANRAIDFLRERGVAFAPGLSATELAYAEKKYDFLFPPDLREFLSLGMPMDDANSPQRCFPNWRHLGDVYTNKMLQWVANSIELDVADNDFWLPSLGVKPDGLDARIAAIKKTFQEAPKLIPVYSHRFIPSEPSEVGNPVISFWQPVDVIYYGSDLLNYFQNEFGDPAARTMGQIKKIRFWSNLIDGDFTCVN